MALSYGQDRRWKERLIALAAPVPGARAVDLATGTGDIAYALASRGADVVGLDVTTRMIELARGKAAGFAGAAPDFLVGDMVALPFATGAFDIVTTGYGLRNVPDLPNAIDEILRVLKPGGQALSLDFNRPANFAREERVLVLSDAGRGLSGLDSPSRSRHLPLHFASIRNYPAQNGLRS